MVVGNRRFTSAFKGVGFEAVVVEEAGQFAKTLALLGRERDVSVVIVSEELAEAAPDAIGEFRRRSRAVLTAVPAHDKSLRTGYRATRELVESSLGIDLLGKD